MSCCTGMPISSVTQFLRELAVLAGQDDTAENPMLELQVGDVVSRTTVEMADGIEYMVVTASLPITKQSRYLPARTDDACCGEVRPRDATIAWNADTGCYVATRRIRTRDLKDDRSVMDTILLTVDEAIGWQDLLEKIYLR